MYLHPSFVLRSGEREKMTRITRETRESLVGHVSTVRTSSWWQADGKVPRENRRWLRAFSLENCPRLEIKVTLNHDLSPCHYFFTAVSTRPKADEQRVRTFTFRGELLALYVPLKLLSRETACHIFRTFSFYDARASLLPSREKYISILRTNARCVFNVSSYALLGERFSNRASELKV